MTQPDQPAVPSLGEKVPCSCRPGDGTQTCLYEDQCYEEWLYTGVAGHDA